MGGTAGQGLEQGLEGGVRVSCSHAWPRNSLKHKVSHQGNTRQYGNAGGADSNQGEA